MAKSILMLLRRREQVEARAKAIATIRARREAVKQQVYIAKRREFVA